jgi:sulfoxide reductase heme-binding subunit YedZ
LTDWLDRRSTPLLLGLIAGLLAVAAGLLAGGDAAERAGLAARWTARAGLPLFLIAFLASTFARRWPRPTTRALLRRRRQWGLGFALAHTIHLVALGDQHYRICAGADMAVADRRRARLCHSM